MKVSSGRAAEMVFEIAGFILGKEESGKAVRFLDDMTVEEDRKHKAECEDALKELIGEIASFPDTAMQSDLRAAVMSRPFIVRAYLLCWLGEASEDLTRSKKVLLPCDPTLQGILSHLLQSRRPFWR